MLRGDARSVNVKDGHWKIERGCIKGYGNWRPICNQQVNARHGLMAWNSVYIAI